MSDGAGGAWSARTRGTFGVTVEARLGMEVIESVRTNKASSRIADLVFNFSSKRAVGLSTLKRLSSGLARPQSADIPRYL